MPLLNATYKKSKKLPLNFLLEESLLIEVKAYCEWAGLCKPSEFIIQAISYVLKNDKEWRKTWGQKEQISVTEALEN